MRLEVRLPVQVGVAVPANVVTQERDRNDERDTTPARRLARCGCHGGMEGMPGARLLPVAVLLAGACAPRAASDWASPAQRLHPLVGSIWDVASGDRIDADTLVATLVTHPLVLLGEKHDNPDHHRLQARVLESLLAAGRWPAVAFEMLAGDLGPDVDRVRTEPAPSPSDLRLALDWDVRGWPAWELYEPIFATALAARLPIVAADLDPATLAALGREGATALPPPERTHLGLHIALPADVHAAMAAEIREAHCGRASDAMVARMVTVQRARDGALARALLAAAARPDADGAVLIAGIGHVRRDHGVPALLRGWAPDTSVASVAFLEVIADADTPTADLAARQLSQYPFDFMWFTPRVDERDPCERFRRRLERLGRPTAAHTVTSWSLTASSVAAEQPRGVSE